MTTDPKTEWTITIEDDRLVLRDPDGKVVDTDGVSRRGSRRLSNAALDSGAGSVRHAYDLRRTEN